MVSSQSMWPSQDHMKAILILASRQKDSPAGFGKNENVFFSSFFVFSPVEALLHPIENSFILFYFHFQFAPSDKALEMYPLVFEGPMK